MTAKFKYIGQLVADTNELERFKELCKHLTLDDIESLDINNLDSIDEREFFVQDITLRFVEDLGLSPSFEIALPTSFADETTKNILENLTSCCISNDPNAGAKCIAVIGVNAIDHNSSTPLMYAVGNCRLEMTRLLIENGADPNLITPKMETAMHTSAITICSKEIFEVLRSAGGRVDIKNGMGKTARDLLIENDRGHWLTSSNVDE